MFVLLHTFRIALALRDDGGLNIRREPTAGLRGNRLLLAAQREGILIGAPT
jgi:hypothetical protein